MLIVCNECGKNISSKATQCPHCGCPDIKEWESIKIANSVTKIDDDAFESFEEVEEVIIPSSVKVIGARAFYGCNLKNITIPNSVTIIGEEAFAYCQLLESIALPNSVDEIKAEAFSCCEKLSKITIPSSVTFIGEDAFECRSHNDVHVYIESLESWCRIKFESPRSNPLNAIEPSFHYGYDTDYVSHLYINHEEITEIVLPRISQLNSYVFAGFRTLKSIVIPDSLTSIGEGVFIGCKNLKSLILPTSISELNNSIFAYCYNLSDIKIPNSIVRIGNNAFCRCINLKNVALPKSLRQIENFAFVECKGLIDLVIPASTDSIDKDAFYGCRNLKSVTAPERFRTFFEDKFPHIEFKTINHQESYDGFDDLNPHGLDGNDYEAWIDSVEC